MFDECVHVEEQHLEQGFQEGVEQGRILGRDEGRILGLEKGFDIGYEVGLYMGCVFVLTSQRLNMMNTAARESKLHRHVDALYRLLSCDLGSSEGALWWDPHNEGLQEYMNSVRSKFKIIMAMISPEQRTCIESMMAGSGASLSPAAVAQTSHDGSTDMKSSTAYRSTTLTSMSSTNQTEYLSGYPFQGDVLGLVDLSPCTNFTEMWQNFNYTDPENPTAGGGSVELTNLVTYSQLGAFPTPGFTSEDLPPAKDILPWFGADGEVFQADAYDTKCWNRSLSSPVSCQENCLEYLDLFNATWFNLGDLYCMQSYPEPGYASLQSPVPPNGNVNMILTNQCSQYTYGPKQGADSVTMYTLTDTWGNVYALQSAGTNASTPEEWQSLVESAGYPEGWTVSTENLTEPEIHYSYVIGNDCWLVILKDSAGNAWQQYQYAQPLEQSSFLGSMDCPALAKSGGGPVPAPGPVSGAVRIGGGSATALLHMMLLLLTLLLFMLKR